MPASILGIESAAVPAWPPRPGDTLSDTSRRIRAMKSNCRAIFASSLCLAAVVAAQPVLAADQKFGPDAQKLSEAQHRGIEFLKASQADDGTWTSNPSTGLTALAITALLKSGVPMTDRTVVQAPAKLTLSLRIVGWGMIEP